MHPLLQRPFIFSISFSKWKSQISLKGAWKRLPDYNLFEITGYLAVMLILVTLTDFWGIFWHDLCFSPPCLSHLQKEKNKIINTNKIRRLVWCKEDIWLMWYNWEGEEQKVAWSRNSLKVFLVAWNSGRRWIQTLHSDRLLPTWKAGAGIIQVPCSAHITVSMNFMTIEIKKYLPLAGSGQAGASLPVMYLHFSPTSCATSVKLTASSWYFCFSR